MAGLLIASVGATSSFWAMFAGFVISAVLVGSACMPTPPVHDSDQHWFTDALDGARLVIREPAIRSTTVLSTISFALSYSVIAVVLPVVYQGLDKPKELGLLFMIFSAGGVLGALVYSAVGTRLPRRPVFVAGLFAAAAVAGVFAYEPDYWIQLLAMAAGGFMTGPVNPIVNVVLQERTAEEIRGRALSMVFAFAYALFPLGYVAAGFMVKGLGANQTFSIMAAGSVVVAVWAMLTPALRGMNAPPMQPPADITPQEG